MIEGKIFFLTKETVIDVWGTECVWIQQREKYLYLYTYTHRTWIYLLWKHTSIHLRKRMLWAYGFSLHRGNILRCQGDIFPSWVISESSFPHSLRVSHHHNQIIWKTGFQLHRKCIKDIETKTMHLPVGLQQGSGFQDPLGPVWTVYLLTQAWRDPGAWASERDKFTFRSWLCHLPAVYFWLT